MNVTFAQAVVTVFTIAFQALKQIDERTGGSGQNETLMNEALAALQGISNQMSSDILDAPATTEPPTEPPAQ